jgi:hypothetical protein
MAVKLAMRLLIGRNAGEIVDRVAKDFGLLGRTAGAFHAGIERAHGAVPGHGTSRNPAGMLLFESLDLAQIAIAENPALGWDCGHFTFSLFH